MSTVILGGGIIGLSTAYYLSLSRPPSESANRPIHIIDSSSELLASASGYSGGFLALDWFAPAVASLGALSFRLHRELAVKHDGQRRWGYAGSQVYSLSVDDWGVGKTGKKVRGEDWLLEGTSRAAVVGSNSAIRSGNNQGAERGEVINDDGTPAWITPQLGGTVDTISGPEECAQVEPRELCEFLLSECKARGVQIHLSTTAIGVLKDDAGILHGLQVKDGKTSSSEIECKKIVIAAGAWTPRVFKSLFPNSNISVPIDPLAGHSLAFRSPRYKKPFINPSKRKLASGDDEQMCYAIYCAPGPHWSYAPEAYARLARGGQPEVWIGGLNDSSMQLPQLATDVKAMLKPESMKELRRTTVQLTGLSRESEKLNNDDLETIREGLCFRPISQSGKPILAPVRERDLADIKLGEDSGIWIASGHGPWGISLSLGSGLVMSEMLQGEKTSADVSGLVLT